MTILSKADEEKLKSFVHCFIEPPLLREIQGNFDRLRYNKTLDAEPLFMSLTGEAGCGKSFLISHYKNKVNDDATEGFSRKTILVSRIPSKPSLESTMVELLKDLGQWGVHFVPGKRNAGNLTESLIKCLKRCETELILIDDFHELIENNTTENCNQIANRLKHISVTSKIPIVIVGLPCIEQIAQDHQWESRLLIRRAIPFFNMSREPQHFISFLKGFAERMPFAITPKLEEQHTAFALFAACNGSLRTLKHLLDESVKQALLSEAETLLKDHIAKAFSIFYPEQENPFMLPIDEIKACEVKSTSESYLDNSAANPSPIPIQFTDKLPISQLLKIR